ALAGLHGEILRYVLPIEITNVVAGQRRGIDVRVPGVAPARAEIAAVARLVIVKAFELQAEGARHRKVGSMVPHFARKRIDRAARRGLHAAVTLRALML